MKIAVITGASSGIGKEVFRQIPSAMGVEEVWVIARNAEKLTELQSETVLPVRAIPMDLSLPSSWEEYRNLLDAEKPQVVFLANCSGFGKFGGVEEISLADALGMVDLNCAALTAITLHTLPFMQKGGKIMQIASVAAFQPIPYIAVYGASKAYVLSYSRALNKELRPRGISVTAVCPFWTKTAFFDRAVKKDGKRPVVIKYAAMYDPVKVVKRAYRDTLRGKDVSKYGGIARLQAFACKLLPHSLVMKVWMRQQKLKAYEKATQKTEK